MACKLITAPTFPLLQERLLKDLNKAGATEPLSPKWVIAPNATIANHLRILLAQEARDGAFAGVRVLHLSRFVQRLVASFGLPPVVPWGAIHDLLLFELAAGFTGKSPLASLNTISGGPVLLRETFINLAEGGFGSETAYSLEELTSDQELSQREREVLRAYIDWLGLLKKREIAWGPLVTHQLAEQITEVEAEALNRALGSEPGQTARVYLHGFYEWTDTNLGWISALAQRIETAIYYPHAEKHAAFSFSKSVLDGVRFRLGAEAEEKLAPSPSATGDFFGQTFPEGKFGDCPSFLTWQHASGTRAEAISAAVRIRQWLDDESLGFRPGDIAVIAPDAEGYVESVHEVFAAFGIPLRVADVAAGIAPQDEPIRMLARIWEQQAPAEWVLALLRLRSDAPCAEGVNLEGFEEKVRKLGLWGGTAWRTALTRVEFSGIKGDDQPERHHVQFDAKEKRLIEEILTFVAGEGTAPLLSISVKEALLVLERMRDRWVPESSALNALIETVQTANQANEGMSIELRQWTQWLMQTATATTRRDALTDAVLFVPLIRARGLTPKALVILGLAAGQLPVRVGEDPLLSERASAKLVSQAEQIGHWMTSRSRLAEEMLLLFFLINTAAEQVHWVVPETDAQGKAVAPTPWVQRYLQQWGPKSGMGRISRAPIEQAVYLAKLEAKSGTFLPPPFAVFVTPSLVQRCFPDDAQANQLASVQQRGNKPEWSGCLGFQPTIRKNKIAVTSLEALAKCPYRFYVATIANWEPLEPLSLSHDLNAMVRGNLLHKLLEQTVAPHLKTKSLGQIAIELLAGDGRALAEVAAALPQTDAAFALTMLPTPFQQAALDDVIATARSYFEFVRESATVPQATELPVERAFPGLGNIKVVGKIDCENLDKDIIELLDYKSGKRPPYYSRQVALGHMIQAVLYPWLQGSVGAEFKYVYCGDDEPEYGKASGAPTAETFLAECLPILQEGRFIATSSQMLEELGVENVSPCRYCQFVSACRRFESGSAHRHAELFKNLCEARNTTLTAVANGGQKE